MVKSNLPQIKIPKSEKEIKKDKAKSDQATQNEKLDYIITLLEEWKGGN